MYTIDEEIILQVDLSDINLYIINEQFKTIFIFAFIIRYLIVDCITKLFIYLF